MLEGGNATPRRGSPPDPPNWKIRQNPARRLLINSVIPSCTLSDWHLFLNLSRNVGIEGRIASSTYTLYLPLLAIRAERSEPAGKTDAVQTSFSDIDAGTSRLLVLAPSPT